MISIKSGGKSVAGLKRLNDELISFCYSFNIKMEEAIPMEVEQTHPQWIVEQQQQEMFIRQQQRIEQLLQNQKLRMSTTPKRKLFQESLHHHSVAPSSNQNILQATGTP